MSRKVLTVVLLGLFAFCASTAAAEQIDYSSIVSKQDYFSIHYFEDFTYREEDVSTILSRIEELNQDHSRRLSEITTALHEKLNGLAPENSFLRLVKVSAQYGCIAGSEKIKVPNLVTLQNSQKNFLFQANKLKEEAMKNDQLTNVSWVKESAENSVTPTQQEKVVTKRKIQFSSLSLEEQEYVKKHVSSLEIE